MPKMGDTGTVEAPEDSWEVKLPLLQDDEPVFSVADSITAEYYLSNNEALRYLVYRAKIKTPYPQALSNNDYSTIAKIMRHRIDFGDSDKVTLNAKTTKQEGDYLNYRQTRPNAIEKD